MLRKETFPGKSLSTEGTGQLSGGQVGHVVLVQAPELNFSQNSIRAKSIRKKTVQSENLPTPVSWECFATDVAHEHCT